MLDVLELIIVGWKYLLGILGFIMSIFAFGFFIVFVKETLSRIFKK